MRLKPGVSISGWSTEMSVAAHIVEGALREFGVDDCVVTSGTEGRRGDKVHSDISKHYDGNAGDFRTRDLAPANKQLLSDEVSERLGKDFDVVLERDHLHVEFDPK